MRIGGVIIAGGRSTRMGQEKALIALRGKPVMRWIIERLAPQVRPLAINANGESLTGFGLPVIPDEVNVGTPLAGLHAALRWGAAEGCDSVLTVPSDSPFLPRDLVARLTGEAAAVAASGGQTHYLTGLWPTVLLAKLEDALQGVRHARENGGPAGVEVTQVGGVVRMQDWVALCGARNVEWPSHPFDPFFNVNTPDELAEAEAIAAEFYP